MVNYMNWVRTSGHGQSLVAYNDWVFGPDPVNRTPGNRPLFVHGTIGKADVRKESPIINTNDLIIVHVIGTNYTIDDPDPVARGSSINNDTSIRNACRHSAQTEDQLVSVKFKKKSDPGWTDLNAGVEEVSMTPVNFYADPGNTYLNDWDIPMPSGQHRGAWSSKLLLMKIPQEGDFELRSKGTSVGGYEQNTEFKIHVKKR
jgi:hypothetical protein